MEHQNFAFAKMILRDRCREGCASDVKIRNPTPKVTRGLREHMLDVHKTLCAPRKMNIENVQNEALPRSQPLEVESTKYWPLQNVVQVHPILRLPRKMTSKTTSHGLQTC